MRGDLGCSCSLRLLDEVRVIITVNRENTGCLHTCLGHLLSLPSPVLGSQ